MCKRKDEEWEMGRFGRTELTLLGLTGACILLVTGYFFGQHSLAQPYYVNVQYQLTEEVPVQGDVVGDDGYPQSLLPGELICINTASVKELTRLPGIGEKRAQAVVQWREDNGPFTDIQQLMQVYGIGESIFQGLQDYVTLEVWNEGGVA